MQPATESLAAIVSSNERKDAATRPVPFPSEGRNYRSSKSLGPSLGNTRFIETQRLSSLVPKNWFASAGDPSTSRKFAEGVAEADPPDKRRRPPRANRRALVFVGTWAAANPEYANAALRSSAPLNGRRA